jgi:hypothetical protein
MGMGVYRWASLITVTDPETDHFDIFGLVGTFASEKFSGTG